MTFVIFLIIIIIAQAGVIFFKERLLNLFSIYLALIALIPFLFSIGLYFGETPVIEYEIFSKHSSRDSNNYVYDFDISISTKKNNVVLLDRGIALNELIEGASSIGLHPKYYGTLKILGTREGRFFIGDNEEDLLEERVQLTCGYRITTEKEKDKISVKYLLNTKTDIAKLGPFAVFQPHYEYRFIAEIPVNFKNTDKQKGYFKKVD